MDDTFLLFRSRFQADKFLEFANMKHDNINFTIEYESEDRLPFLDVLVFRDEDRFKTTVFRKNTFTGLGSNFYSHCFFNFKLNSLSTLIHRAFTITSDWQSFHNEILFLHDYFVNNCYPSRLFCKTVKTFLNNFFQPKFKLPSVSKLPVYATIQLIYSERFYSDLRRIIESHIPAVNIKLIRLNRMNLGSIFRSKERLPTLMTSGLIYLFDCPRCDLGKYVGSTRRLLKVRIDSHKGVSYRTGTKLSNPEFSNIREHTRKCKTSIEYKDFKVIGRTNNSHELPILESLFIKQIVPQLNAQTSSTPLHLS